MISLKYRTSATPFVGYAGHRARPESLAQGPHPRTCGCPARLRAVNPRLPLPRHPRRSARPIRHRLRPCPSLERRAAPMRAIHRTMRRPPVSPSEGMLRRRLAPRRRAAGGAPRSGHGLTGSRGAVTRNRHAVCGARSRSGMPSLARARTGTLWVPNGMPRLCDGQKRGRARGSRPKQGSTKLRSISRWSPG